MIEHLEGRNHLSISMVCLGNICRSPMAAAVLEKKKRAVMPLTVAVDSAGTGAWHIGQGPHPTSKRVWERAGYEYLHKAKQFTQNDFFVHDLILVMDSNNYHNLFDLCEDDEQRSKIFYLRNFDTQLRSVDPESSEYYKLEISDPYNQSEAAYEKTLAKIEKAVDGLIQELINLSR